jgi:integrase/recombinase XerD
MRIWPDRNDSAIGRSMRQRRLRHPQTPSFYHRVLRGFQDVVKRCECSLSRVIRQTLEVWLHERGPEWSASPLLHRACIIDRFLDFLVQEESIISNPIAELRTKYCVKGGETIVRALLALEPDRALEALRQTAPVWERSCRSDEQSRCADAHEGIPLRHKCSDVPALRPPSAKVP